MTIVRKETTKILIEDSGQSVGVKFDGEKARWDLIQPLATQEYVGVLTYGAKKYSDDNWRLVPELRKRYFAAAIRHVWAWWLGEKYDEVSDGGDGRHHLAHAVCCLMFLLEIDLEQKGAGEPEVGPDGANWKSAYFNGEPHA